MTRSTITREESIQAVFDLKVGYRLGFADIEILKRVARMALAAMYSEPVAIIDQANLDYLRSGADADVWPPEREEMGDVLLYRHAQPAPVVPDENVSFHRLPGESEYDRLNRQREWMESKSKIAKVTAAAPDDLTERLLRLRAQATLDGSYLGTEEWDSLACDAIKALNACRSAMLQAGTLTNEGETILHNYHTAMEGIGHIRRTLEETFGGLHGTHVEPDVLMDCKTICDAIYAAYSGNSPAIPDGYMLVPREPTEEMNKAGWAAMNEHDAINPTYRAMIAAAAHDAPDLNSVQSVVTVPGKWIPVSERMPPSRHEVLVGCWWGEKPRWCSKWATYIPGHPDAQQSGWLIPGASWVPTHWQELPAAPQEEKP